MLLAVGLAGFAFARGNHGLTRDDCVIFAVGATALTFAAWAHGLYDDVSQKGPPLTIAHFVMAWFEGCGLTAFVIWFMSNAAMMELGSTLHVLPPGVWIGLSVIASAASYGLSRHAGPIKPTKLRAVILGANPSGHRLASRLSTEKGHAWRVVAMSDGRQDWRDPAIPFIGGIENVIAAVRRGEVDTVFIATAPSARDEQRHLIDQLRTLAIDVYIVPDIDLQSPDSPLPIVQVGKTPMTDWKCLCKRIEDIILSSTLLFLSGPAMIMIALLIKLTSPGPVLFKQPRTGFNGSQILVFKFRTMFHHLTDDHADRQTSRNDDRVTRVGTWLRRSSLDELPQLLNVLMGDMSVVGPRPHALRTTAGGIPLEDAARNYASRHRVKPGITGWAQVNGHRGALDSVMKIIHRVDHDLYYIDNWSLRLDIAILWRTARLVLRDHNAF
jgi:Undecaprenyl-phosphate glucose phosphotransferase